MTDAYTPGPWRMATDDPKTWERAGETEIACVVSHSFSAIEIMASEDGHNDDPRANARLIAAAPDLLEALQLARDLFVNSKSACAEICDAAILKATTPSAGHIPDAGNMIEPVEAVAWRFWHEGGWNFSLADPSPHLADCVERDALYTHPAPIKPSGWRDIATAPRDGTMLLVGYDEGVAREGAMEDRQRVFEARWNDVQGTWSARNGFLLHSDATHWQPLPHPPSAHPAPIKPSGDTGELRERVAQIIEAAIERHNPVNSLRHTMSDADEILDLIQSERGGA